MALWMTKSLFFIAEEGKTSPLRSLKPAMLQIFSAEAQSEHKLVCKVQIKLVKEQEQALSPRARPKSTLRLLLLFA